MAGSLVGRVRAAEFARSFNPEKDLQPGDFCLVAGVWWARLPAGERCLVQLVGATTEPDGTVSCEKILFRPLVPSGQWFSGRIRRGVWTWGVP